MRLHLLFAAITLSAACSRAEAVERPREFVERFCKAEESWEIRGLPGKHHERLYDSFLGVELIQTIRNANSQLEAWMRKHRDSNQNRMIPHIESNLFSGFSEGPTSWRVGRSNRTPLGVTVDVHREYREADTVYKWIDRVLLDRDGKSWVVRDIDCHLGGSLLGSILDFRNSIEAGAETAESETSKSHLATLRAAQVPWWIPAQPQLANCQR